jgi:hypothetical protein
MRPAIMPIFAARLQDQQTGCEPYGFAEAAGEAAGGALPAGKTPAPESSAGETPGEV